MSTNAPALADARQRVEAAFAPALFRAAGAKLAELLADHLAAIQSGGKNVLNWRDPHANLNDATAILNDPAACDDSTPDAIVARFRELIGTMLARGQNLHDPRYIGHQVPPSLPLAGLFDSLVSTLNQVSAIYEMGPFAAACETALIDALGERFGLPPGTFAGVITHGGSLANTTALLTARNVVFGESWESGMAWQESRNSVAAPVLVAHAEAHYCIARSAGILGLGTHHVVKAALDTRRRIDPKKLDDQLAQFRDKKRPVLAVVACACATPIGAFDPLADIADVCEKHGIWLHVDAAHGGAACFSHRHRHLVAGLERADSFICDAHKMLYMPALCAFVFYRDKNVRFKTFQQDAPYLFDPSAPDMTDFDHGLKTVECTRRAAAYGLWGSWSLFGPQLFADLVDVTFALGRQFYEMLSAANDFEPLHEPECNIVAFRYRPVELRDASLESVGRFQLELRRSVIESGEYYLVPTIHDGVAALRVTIINPLTTTSHLHGLLATLRERGEQLLSSSSR